MALDEALMDSVRAGARPVLRFYRWHPRCLSLGRNQPARDRYDLALLAARGTDVVRRPTGGRAVLHDRELTYSVIAPEGTLGSLRESYAAINRALAAGLRRLGVPATLQPGGARASAPSLAPCFRDPAEGEVIAAGRKLIGSAQWRERGVMLQHGSLLLEDDQREVAEFLAGSPPHALTPLAKARTPLPRSGEGLRDLSATGASQRAPDKSPLSQFRERGLGGEGQTGSGADAPRSSLLAPREGRVATLRDFLDPLPSWEALTAALAAGWAEVLEIGLEAGEPTAAELACAEQLAARYVSAAWTWRL